MKIDHKKFSASDLAASLKQARENKGLSQRDLSAKIDVPQSHISKIESGKVDLRVSSLIELARALDLEIVLVPRSTVPAVEALSRQTPEREISASKLNRALQIDESVIQTHRALEKTYKEATKLSRAIPMPELTRLADTTRALNALRIPLPQIDQINTALKSITASQDSIRHALTAFRNVSEMAKGSDVTRWLREINQATDVLRTMRNNLAHGAIPSPVRSLPAYRLSDGDDDDV